MFTIYTNVTNKQKHVETVVNICLPDRTCQVSGYSAFNLSKSGKWQYSSLCKVSGAVLEIDRHVGT